MARSAGLALRLPGAAASCMPTPRMLRAKAQRMRGNIVEIARKVFAIDGMPLVLAIAYTGAL